MKIVSWNINGVRSNIICEGPLKNILNMMNYKIIILKYFLVLL